MRILFRAEAGGGKGLGHFVRCLALAQGVIDEGHEVLFLMSPTKIDLAFLIGEDPISIKTIQQKIASKDDAIATIDWAREWAADFVVVDGYDFLDDYFKLLKTAGLKIVTIDDLQDILLRRVLRACPQKKYDSDPVKNILVTMGGTDPLDLSLPIAKSLAQVLDASIHIHVLMGAPNLEMSQWANSQIGRVTIYTAQGNVLPLFQKMDLAISAAGSTCYELAYLGVPLGVVAVAPNQEPVVKKLLEKEAAFIWKSANDVLKYVHDFSLRQKMSKNLQELVDGDGVSRLIYKLSAEPFRLRPILLSDSDTVLLWTNDPETRTASFNSHVITYKEHQEWFLKRHQKILDEPFFMAVDQNNAPLGLVRFEKNSDNSFTVGLNLNPSCRGRGLGSLVLKKAIYDLKRKFPQVQVLAYVKADNENSQKTFLKAGFVKKDEIYMKGHRAFCYEF